MVASSVVVSSLERVGKCRRKRPAIIRHVMFPCPRNRERVATRQAQHLGANDVVAPIAGKAAVAAPEVDDGRQRTRNGAEIALYLANVMQERRGHHLSGDGWPQKRINLAANADSVPPVSHRHAGPQRLLPRQQMGNSPRCVGRGWLASRQRTKESLGQVQDLHLRQLTADESGGVRPKRPDAVVRSKPAYKSGWSRWRHGQAILGRCEDQRHGRADVLRMSAAGHEA